LLVAKRQRLERLSLQLDERGPLRVLERGYAVCYDAAGNVVHTADAVALGDRVRVQLARGRLAAEVKEKEPGKS
jgi:exodeoxyribonuclease VII large subunit